ncbi:MAG: hypothetical protein GC186_10120 [Rhodobacteraceae bacterium]|nr:hypothetical protein [Paracoccaceae bacterium]
MKLMLSAALLAVSVLPAAAQSIGGRYAVDGTNLDGSAYSGTATITLTSKTTCTIKWVTGGSTSHGICSRNGNAFAAAYVLGNDVGLVIYKVNDDGSLSGLWTVAGQDGSGTEDLTPE